MAITPLTTEIDLYNVFILMEENSWSIQNIGDTSIFIHHGTNDICGKGGYCITTIEK